MGTKQDTKILSALVWEKDPKVSAPWGCLHRALFFGQVIFHIHECGIGPSLVPEASC